MSHLNTAYQMGSHDAYVVFNKQAEGEALGDPNYWSGGTPAPGMEGAEGGAPASAEDGISLLPAGTFQGLQTKITPDGAKSVSLKVSPDALQAPDSLASMFQTGENTKIEIETPDPIKGDLAAGGAGGMPLPGEEVGAAPGGMAPAPGPATDGAV